MYNKITQHLRVRLFFPRTNIVIEKPLTDQKLWEHIKTLLNSIDCPIMHWDGTEDNPMFTIKIFDGMFDDHALLAELECCDLTAWTQGPGAEDK